MAVGAGGVAKSISVAPFGLDLELMSRWRGSLRLRIAHCRERHGIPFSSLQ